MKWWEGTAFQHLFAPAPYPPSGCAAFHEIRRDPCGESAAPTVHSHNGRRASKNSAAKVKKSLPFPIKIWYDTRGNAELYCKNLYLQGINSIWAASGTVMRCCFPLKSIKGFQRKTIAACIRILPEDRLFGFRVLFSGFRFRHGRKPERSGPIPPGFPALGITNKRR